jgi:hypothetical protein
MNARAQTRVSHQYLRVAKANIAPPKLWVPYLRDGFIVAKPGSPPACWWGGTVGIVRSTTAPAHLTRTPVSQATY